MIAAPLSFYSPELNMWHNQLPWLNAANDTGKYQKEICLKLLTDFPNDELIGLEIGCAYGGGVEHLAYIWKGRGKVYGYDTFEGHPDDLADDIESEEARCMDLWYNSGRPFFSRDKLTYEYQRMILNMEKLDNATLVKGRINEHSFDDIEKAHFAIIDLDLIKPTKIAYYAIKDKIVKGGYLFMHDTLPPDHLPMIYDFVYNEVVKDKRWQIIAEIGDKGNVTILRRI